MFFAQERKQSESKKKTPDIQDTSLQMSFAHFFELSQPSIANSMLADWRS